MGWGDGRYHGGAAAAMLCLVPVPAATDRTRLPCIVLLRHNVVPQGSAMAS
jgi:hypothetical protein